MTGRVGRWRLTIYKNLLVLFPLVRVLLCSRISCIREQIDTKAMLLIGAYFDESGVHSDALVATVAGFVAEADVWIRIETEWLAVLGEFADRGVTAFHTADCLAGTGQFERLQGWERAYVTDNLTRIIVRNNPTPIWASVIVEDWNFVNEPELRALFPSAYHLCFDHCMARLYEWSKAHGDVVVAPVFAEQNEYEERAREIFRAYQGHSLHGKLFHSISFALANKLPALQTADLLAHELSEYWTTIEYQRSPKSAFCIRSSLAKGEGKLDSLPLGGCYDKLSLNNLVRQLRERRERA